MQQGDLEQIREHILILTVISFPQFGTARVQNKQGRDSGHEEPIVGKKVVKRRVVIHGFDPSGVTELCADMLDSLWACSREIGAEPA